EEGWPVGGTFVVAIGYALLVVLESVERHAVVGSGDHVALAGRDRLDGGCGESWGGEGREGEGQKNAGFHGGLLRAVGKPVMDLPFHKTPERAFLFPF